MMEKIADYRLAPPPSDEDISGEIIPVADIDGRDAALRKEDYYYLRELWNVFRNESSADTTGFSSFSFRNLISNVLYYMNQWKSDSYMASHTHLKSGLASYSFTGDLVTNAQSSTWSNQFFNWMKNNSAIELLNTSATAPSAKLPMTADIVRLLYWFLSKDMFRQVKDTSLGGTRAFTFTTQKTSIPYTYVTLDNDRNVVSASNTGTIEGSGGRIVANGINGNGQQVGVHVLQKWDSDASKYKYYNSLAFPSSTVSASVTFSAPVSDAYALVDLYLSTGSGLQGLQLLRPMTGSGTSWSVELIKRSDFDLVTSNISFPAFDEWCDTAASVNYYNASVVCVFAKFSSPYFALPSGWDWSPS